ncbi:structural toxin protein RtxA [Hyaloscypha variabilis]
MASPASVATRFKLVFFVPLPALSACKSAIFEAGAGHYQGPGNYTECCFTVIGTGQFRPGATAKPHIGTIGTLEEVQEAKAVEALKKAHPYEEVAYDVYRMEDF